MTSNLNILKLMIAMQLELRTIIQKASDMERTLSEVMAHVEGPSPVPELPRNVYSYRKDDSYRKRSSQKLREYWASPRGMARRKEMKKSMVKPAPAQ